MDHACHVDLVEYLAIFRVDFKSSVHKVDRQNIPCLLIVCNLPEVFFTLAM